MTPLLLLRHGPTAWNRAGRIQGLSDQPLDDAGRREVAGWSLDLALDGRPATQWQWLVSPLARARETAAILARPWPALAPQVEPLLSEMSWGDWEGQRLAELRARDPAGLAAREARGLDFQPPGGESPRQVQARLQPLLCRLAREKRPTLAVCHKGVIRALYALASGWDMTGRPPKKLREPAAHRLALDADGRLSVDRLNLPLRKPHG